MKMTMFEKGMVVGVIISILLIVIPTIIVAKTVLDESEHMVDLELTQISRLLMKREGMDHYEYEYDMRNNLYKITLTGQNEDGDNVRIVYNENLNGRYPIGTREACVE